MCLLWIVVVAAPQWHHWQLPQLTANRRCCSCQGQQHLTVTGRLRLQQCELPATPVGAATVLSLSRQKVHPQMQMQMTMQTSLPMALGAASFHCQSLEAATRLRCWQLDSLSQC